MIILLILAHLWYPRECCSEVHCHPVPCDKIKRAANGDFIYEGMSFSGSMVRESQDANCHVCSGPMPYCLFLRPDA